MRGPLTYLATSAVAVLLGLLTGPHGSALVAVFGWLLLAAGVEVAAGRPPRLNVLPLALVAAVVVAVGGPGAPTALLGVAGVVYGTATIVAILRPGLRRVLRAVRVGRGVRQGGQGEHVLGDAAGRRVETQAR
ncbi:hypothetical protein [Actinoplanes sp. HUAS TT8]|uniref:hypothetical protein n=1 Tax=Actinoplanes sp. HUAS TT8 TaxID=3447453 RepID=UPI003F52880B